MRQTLVIAALLGLSASLPQQRANPVATGPVNTNVRILSFESYQDGANFGHQLFQEDGTSSGQKYGPDGLLYGFYSYVNPDNQRVKVYWRAGQGVGYEVIGVEGLIKENLGNLRATISQTPQEQPAAPRPAPARPAPLRPAPARQAPVRPAPTAAPHVPRNTFIPSAVTTTRPPAADTRKTQAKLNPNQLVPVVPEPPQQHFRQSPALQTTPPPESRFDYPATLNLERTNQGFFSSLTATR